MVYRLPRRTRRLRLSDPASHADRTAEHRRPRREAGAGKTLLIVSLEISRRRTLLIS
jgi:hypothetical protein